MALKGMSPVLTPDLLHVLATMGHGDLIAVVDRNYPAHSRHGRTVHLAGVDTVEAVRAICSLLPIDDVTDDAARRMTPDGEPDDVRPVHRLVEDVLVQAEGRPIALRALERTAFYETAASATACVATADDRAYACFLLTAGVIRRPDGT